MDFTRYGDWHVPPTPVPTSNAHHPPFQPPVEDSLTDEMGFSMRDQASPALNMVGPSDYGSTFLRSSSTSMEHPCYPVPASPNVQRPDINTTPSYAEPEYPAHASLYTPTPLTSSVTLPVPSLPLGYPVSLSSPPHRASYAPLPVGGRMETDYSSAHGESMFRGKNIMITGGHFQLNSGPTRKRRRLGECLRVRIFM